jgi:hypothetical protein
VLAVDPIVNETGKREDSWQWISDNLKRVRMDQSWLSCKDRIERLLKWHRVCDVSGLDMSGTDNHSSRTSHFQNKRQRLLRKWMNIYAT